MVIAGSREIRDYSQLTSLIAKVMPEYTNYERILIMTGGARGVDWMGKRYANEHGYLYKEFKPVYATQNDRYAPLRRNEEMAKLGDILIALWDGKSRGTEHMINCMKKKGKTTHVQNTLTATYLVTRVK